MERESCLEILPVSFIGDIKDPVLDRLHEN